MQGKTSSEIINACGRAALSKHIDVLCGLFPMVYASYATIVLRFCIDFYALKMFIIILYTFVYSSVNNSIT